MKDERKQCKKHHESTIGKIIYGFLLFLPLFAIGSTCLISTFNMSSKEEAEIHYKYETNEVNSANDLIIGNIYKLPYNLPSVENVEKICNIQNIFNFIRNTMAVLVNAEQQNNKSFYLSNTSGALALYSDNSLWLVSDSKSHQINNFIYFVYNGDINIDYLSYITISDYIPINHVETHNVSAQDVFYNSVNKVQESPLFNWTTSTGIYSVLNNTCNSLGITTTLMPLLLTYWLIISVMYFLYDIVLIILNILHRKIHELQESI